MNTFWRRFRTYLIGVGLGLLLVYIFFGDRDLGFWTPEGRVLTAIDSSEISLSDKVICQLTCLSLEEQDWKELVSVANVDFSNSATRKKPCPEYILVAITEKGAYKMYWEVCEQKEKVKFLSIEQTGNNCNC